MQRFPTTRAALLPLFAALTLATTAQAFNIPLDVPTPTWPTETAPVGQGCLAPSAPSGAGVCAIDDGQ